MERPRSLLVRVGSSAIRALRASPWAPLVARAALVGCALLLLAWVGSTAAAGGAGPALASEAGAEPIVPAPDAEAPSPLLIAPPTDAGAPPPHAGARARASPDDPVYLNRATADDLRRLPGCGEKRADAILALRKRIGRFTRVEELLRVKGVGRATLKKWRPLVRLDAA